MRRKRCKVCHVETGINHEGRCPLCQASADALAHGMSYGKWMAQADTVYTTPPSAVAKASRMKTCRWCGKQFEVSSNRRAYCCDQCRDAQLAAWKAAQQKARQQNLKADRPQFPERVCVVCGETYTPRMPKQLTCCPDCGKEHRRRRMRIYRQKRQAEEA